MRSFHFYLRRKKILNENEKLRNIIIDIEKEIEDQLDTKTEDDDFTTINVKGILKVLFFVMCQILMYSLEKLTVHDNFDFRN